MQASCQVLTETISLPRRTMVSDQTNHALNSIAELHDFT